MQPGEVGLAYIFFDNAEAFPDAVDYEFSATSSPAEATPYNTAPLTLTEVNIVGDAIVGTAVNDSDADTVGPYVVSVYCFDGNELRDYRMGFAEQDSAEAGAIVTFSQNLYGRECPQFAVGVSGYFE